MQFMYFPKSFDLLEISVGFDNVLNMYGIHSCTEINVFYQDIFAFICGKYLTVLFGNKIV